MAKVANEYEAGAQQAIGILRSVAALLGQLEPLIAGLQADNSVLRSHLELTSKPPSYEHWLAVAPNGHSIAGPFAEKEDVFAWAAARLLKVVAVEVSAHAGLIVHRHRALTLFANAGKEGSGVPGK